MRSWEKWKKTVFFILCAVIFIRIGYIVFRGELNKHYVIDAAPDLSDIAEIPCYNVTQTFISAHGNLNKLELIFSGIGEDRTGFVSVRLLRQDRLIYQAKLALENINNHEWSQIYVNAPMEIGEEYTLLLDASEDCAQIPNVIFTDGALAAQYGYLAQPGWLDKAVSSSLWLLLLFLFYLFLNKYEAVREAVSKCFHYIYENIPFNTFNLIAEVFLCMAVVNGSGIEFQMPTKIILYAVSMLSVYKFDKKSEHVSKIFTGNIRKIFLYILYFYTAFAFVGQRMLIYPLDMRVTFPKIFVFALAYIWGIPVVKGLICLMDGAGNFLIASGRRGNTVKLVVLSVVLLLLPAAYSLIAYNPGISTPDTLDSMIVNAKHLYGMFDWHPAFYCMVLRAIQCIWDSTYAVILVQYFFWAYVMMEFLLYVRKKGMKDGIILGIAFFCGINAANFMQLNTIWKDIPYTLSILWALVILAKLSIDFEEYRGRLYIYFELVAALIGVFFYRKNGVVSFIVIAVMAAVVLWRNRRALIALAATVVLVGCIKGPVYRYFEVEDPGRYGMYIGLSQDILGAYYTDGEISEKTLEMVNVMTGYNNAEYSYSPTWANQTYDLDVEPSEFILSYIDTFLKNPVTMTRAIIDREDALWDIFLGEGSGLGCVYEKGTMDGQTYHDYTWNDYYPHREYRYIYDGMYEEFFYTVTSQWLNAIVWRAGLFTLLGTVSLILLFSKNGVKKYILIISPVIGHILSLLLSTGWSDFRYFWPLNLMNLAVLALVIILVNGKEKQDAAGNF